MIFVAKNHRSYIGGTIAVKFIAIGAGKNIINTGVKTVAKPNPEKKVIPKKKKADGITIK